MLKVPHQFLCLLQQCRNSRVGVNSVANACLKQVSRARVRLPPKFVAQGLSRCLHARCLIVYDTDHVEVRNLERFSSLVDFLFDVLGSVAFWKRTCLQHAGAKFPAAVDEMARRGVVALSSLRWPSIRGESNELCFPFEELGQIFLPPRLVTFLHQGSDVCAGWNGVTWKEQAEIFFAVPNTRYITENRGKSV